MKERILEFLKSENKSSALFAEEIGVQPSSISHILSGRNNPSLDFILKMLEKYRFLSSDWLLFGKGAMYKEAGMQKLFDDYTDINSEATAGTAAKAPVMQNKKAEESTAERKDSADERPTVEKIVWFFRDGSFREYTPGR